MKIISYTAHNVLRVKDIRFDLEGRNLFLVGGKNRQGKSSALNALLIALCGRSGMDFPEVVLQNGENEGWVEVKLSGDEEMHEPVGFTVQLHLKRKVSGQVVEEFRVLDSTGDEAPEPRTLLKRLCQLRAFDPLAFEKMDAKSKKKLLAELLGLDFTRMDEARRRLYEERTGINKELSTLDAQIKLLPFHEGVPEEEVDTAELMSELESRQKLNKLNERRRKDLEGYQENVDRQARKIQEIKDQIKRLQEKLEFEEGQVTVLCQARDQQKQLVDGLEDSNEEEIREQIRQSGLVNKQVRENLTFKERKAKLESLSLESEQRTEAIKALDEEKTRAISAAQFPVEGMCFSDDGVLLNGLPIEQASKSERVMASVGVGMALNPGLKLLVCQDGSDLDTDTLEAIEKKLVEHDFQMLVEIVTRTKEDEDLCAVVIKDGEVQ